MSDDYPRVTVEISNVPDLEVDYPGPRGGTVHLTMELGGEIDAQDVVFFLEPHVDVKETFHQLVEQWRKERPAASSSIAEIIACPSYLRIIGMGRRALPLIIEQLEHEGSEPDHWCAALEAVTGEDPVPEEAQGDNVRIAQAWIAWVRTTRAVWTFQTSTKPTFESLANEPLAITASPGPPNQL